MCDVLDVLINKIASSCSVFNSSTVTSKFETECFSREAIKLRQNIRAC